MLDDGSDPNETLGLFLGMIMDGAVGLERQWCGMRNTEWIVNLLQQRKLAIFCTRESEYLLILF